MSDSFLDCLPLSNWLIDDYPRSQSVRFPGGGKTDYVAVLRHLHSYLNSKVHNTVQQRNTLSDGDAYLTDHGPAHIQQVMLRASDIVRSQESLQGERDRRASAKYAPSLAPYEVFLLLAAIHFHDVGNMYGREGHEAQIHGVMEDVPCLKDLPSAERRLIADIAQCHGGTFAGSKDTIQRLPQGERANSVARYRPQLIAAVLRLADELADDNSRADDFGLMRPEALPPTCLIFHKYAAALQVSIAPLEGRVDLSFDLHHEDLAKPFQKKADNSIKKVFLLDEIYARTLKTYTELDYCSRFMRQLETRLHCVAVTIRFFRSPRHGSEICDPVQYTIGNGGYPQYCGSDIRETLEHLASGFTGAIKGSELAAKLSKES